MNALGATQRLEDRLKLLFRVVGLPGLIRISVDAADEKRSFKKAVDKLEDRMHKALLGILGFALSMLLSVSPISAQNYPNKPIRLIVAQAPGSGSDNAARVIGQKLADVLGQQVVVDTRPGAGGSLGTGIAAKSAPDGYTLQLVSAATHGTNPALYKKLPYDAVRDFAPITLATITPAALVVYPSLPVRSVSDLIKLAKTRPGQLNFASSGTGGGQHLAAELFRSMAGNISTVHVPYRGTTPAMTALVGGEIEWSMPGLPAALPHIAAKRLRVLAVTSRKRLQDLPDLPTVAETLPGFEVVFWWGFVAPAETPKPIVSLLNAEIAKVLEMSDVKKSLAAMGMIVAPSSAEEFGAFIKAELAKWTKVVKEVNIHLE